MFVDLFPFFGALGQRAEVQESGGRSPVLASSGRWCLDASFSQRRVDATVVHPYDR
jgi:hypothetical protein